MSTNEVQQAGLEWQAIDDTAPPMDGRWVVFADIDGAGDIRLAHCDFAVVELDDWYLGTDLSIWTHWRYMTQDDVIKPATQDAATAQGETKHTAGGPHFSEQHAAEGRLHAAAPDMLEAIKWFVARVDAGEVRSAKTYAKFKEIIAKAEGRS